jgi:hypothetical protein
MMEEFKVGDKVVPKSDCAIQDVYTILAIGKPGIDGHPAWLKSYRQKFGTIMDLKRMKIYFEPGYFRLKSYTYTNTAVIEYMTEDPGPGYVRMNVSVAEEDSDE